MSIVSLDNEKSMLSEISYPELTLAIAVKLSEAVD